MKIALVTNIVAPYRKPLFEQIGKHCDLTVICSAANQADRNWRDWNEKSVSAFKTVTLKGFCLKARHGFFYFQPDLLIALRKLRPDVIITSAFALNTLLGSLYAKITRTPSLLWSASTCLSERKYSALRLWFRKFLVRLNSAYVAVGVDATEYLVSIGAREDKCFTAVNAVEDVTRHLEFGKMREEAQGIRSEYSGPILLYTGRFIALKGLDLLLAAYEKIQNVEGAKDATLLIIGSGPLEKELKEEAARRNLKNARFIGFKQERELWPYYLASDVYVLPSREDIWGMVINEAMQCSLPVVCSKFAGAAREMVENDKTGYVVDPYDTDGFAQTLEKIIKDEELRKEMSKAALEKVAGYYSIEVSTKGFLRAIVFARR